MIGLVSGWLWIGLKKLNLPDLAALPIVGFIGAWTNTVCVMGSIYFLLRPEYAKAMGVGIEAVFGLVMAVITGSSIMEAVAALVLVTAIGKVLIQVVARLPMGQSAADTAK